MKAILVFTEMPKSCDECVVRCGGYTAKEYFEKSIKRPSWCPLKPMPQKKSHEEYSWGAEKIETTNDFEDGWNACLDEILGETE